MAIILCNLVNHRKSFATEYRRSRCRRIGPLSNVGQRLFAVHVHKLSRRVSTTRDGIGWYGLSQYPELLGREVYRSRAHCLIETFAASSTHERYDVSTLSGHPSDSDLGNRIANYR
jgi:hypothetical protein